MRGIDADIYSICETHLSGQNIIEIDSYTWIGYNRRDIHRDAPKSSGGVGILIKQWVCDTYNISVIDKTVDGILGVKFVHKETDSDFVVFSCYLPPENSTRGRDAQTFFAHLLAQMYLLGMGIAKKIVLRYITIRDQRIAIRITIRITRFNLSVRMVPLCFQLK